MFRIQIGNKEATRCLLEAGYRFHRTVNGPCFIRETSDKRRWHAFIRGRKEGIVEVHFDDTRNGYHFVKRVSKSQEKREMQRIRKFLHGGKFENTTVRKKQNKLKNSVLAPNLMELQRNFKSSTPKRGLRWRLYFFWKKFRHLYTGRFS